MEKIFRSFWVRGVNPYDLSNELDRNLRDLHDFGWHITNVDCHENPKGSWDGEKYTPSKEYIIIAWNEVKEE